MGSLTFGKRDVAKMSAVLDGEFDSVEDAAKAALLAAEELLADRMKYAVVGQLSGTKERKDVPPGDPEAVKVVLGWFSTESTARGAAESLWNSTASGDTFRTWVLDIFHGTPAEWHTKRKEQYAAIEAKRKEAERVRMEATIEKRMLAAEIRNAGGKGACQCKHQNYDHRPDGSSRGRCAVLDCSCPKWAEQN